MGDEDLLRDLQKERAKILNETHAAVVHLHAVSGKRLQEIERKAVAVAKESGGMPCLVRRTPGPDLTVYHSADASCGRVRDRGNFKRMTEKAAKNASPYAWLYRCSACRWSRAAEIHARRMLELE